MLMTNYVKRIDYNKLVFYYENSKGYSLYITLKILLDMRDIQGNI